jgi:hypothetical protein
MKLIADNRDEMDRRNDVAKAYVDRIYEYENKHSKKLQAKRYLETKVFPPQVGCYNNI